VLTAAMLGGILHHATVVLGGFETHFSKLERE
jgi:hypothetical protein